MQLKKQFDFAYGFKSHFTAINERLPKLEDCLQSRQRIQRNIFPPFGNESLPPSKTISLTGCPIIYPLKKKDLCNYDHICLVSSVLMFYDIIMNILRNKKFECHNEEDDFFTKIENNNIYMYRGSLQDLSWKKGTYECLDVPCVHFHIKINDMKHYLTKILKSDTSSGDMNEKVYHWLY